MSDLWNNSINEGLALHNSEFSTSERDAHVSKRKYSLLEPRELLYIRPYAVGEPEIQIR